jgi:hypothetical protein
MICFDCTVELDEVTGMFDSGDTHTRCEQCAVNKYKRDNPFWEIPLIKFSLQNLKEQTNANT